MRSVADRFWAKVDIPDDPEGCWLWTAHRKQSGYGTFRAWGRMLRAHRVVLVLTGVLVPDDAVVRHVCDNPPCVNPKHLRVGTHSENSRDSFDKGRSSNVGELHPQARVTHTEVLEIRAAHRSSCMAPDGCGRARAGLRAELAEKYGISPGTVSHIVQRITWKHI